MSRALVVYESLFGSGETIAQAIAASLAEHLPVDLVPIADASPTLDDTTRLLVVGGPNHRFGMTTADSRAEAVARGATRPAETGVREWTEALPACPGTAAAVFDTRLATPGFLQRIDHASRSVEKRLRQRDLVLVAPAQHYLVEDLDGPLVSGEVERATAWGHLLAGRLSALPG